MKTTLVIDDQVMSRLKQEAARRRTTISELVESALRMLLDRLEQRIELAPLPTFDGGGATVNVAVRDELYRAMGDS